MKIALVTTQFLPFVGGAEMVVHHLAEQWTRQGHTVCIINHTSAAPPPGAAYAVRKYSPLRGSTRVGSHRFPFRQLAARQISRLLEEFRPEGISAHFGYPAGVWLGSIRPLPRFLITCHGEELEPRERPRKVLGIDRFLADYLNRARKVIALSSRARQMLAEMGVDPALIEQIPNGVDCDLFRQPSAFNFQEAFSLPEGAVTVLSVGRENWAKGYDGGLRAFAQLQHRCPDTCYVVLGAGTEKWRPLARELGVEKHVRFGMLLGRDLVGAYQQADIFFSPSLSELCPVAVLEAMAAGLPVVATDISGSQDMVQSEANGLLTAPGRPEAMAAALERLARDEALRRRWGNCSRDLASAYDWQVISRRYLDQLGPS